MDFRGAASLSFQHAFPEHVVGECVSFVIFQVRSKRTKSATIHADVRRVQVDVGVVPGDIPVPFFSHQIRQSSQRMEVSFPFQLETIVERKTLAVFDSVRDGVKL